LVDCIERIGGVAFDQLWTDFVSPPADGSVVWFEVWLRAPSAQTREIILRQFRGEAARLDLRVGEAELRLRDHTVVMARGTRGQLMGSTALLACIAEIRAGRDFAEFIQELPVAEQADWGRNLLARLDAPDDAVAICLLDTGVNRHPLLAPVFAEGDAHTIKDAWGRADDLGAAGLDWVVTVRRSQASLFTPIVAAGIASAERIRPPAVLESAKMVPPGPANDEHEERHAAAFTAQGVALAGIFSCPAAKGLLFGHLLGRTERRSAKRVVGGYRPAGGGRGSRGSCATPVGSGRGQCAASALDGVSVLES